MFTTRPDTLFGFSFLALSIDHPISNFFKEDKNFLKFKDECAKQVPPKIYSSGKKNWL